MIQFPTEWKHQNFMFQENYQLAKHTTSHEKPPFSHGFPMEKTINVGLKVWPQLGLLHPELGPQHGVTFTPRPTKQRRDVHSPETCWGRWRVMWRVIIDQQRFSGLWTILANHRPT